MHSSSVTPTPEFSPCVIIPVYNHQQALPSTVSDLLALELDVLLIDDGSEQSCLDVQKTLANQYPQVHLFERPQNGGKGAAVKDGLRFARSLGFTHALQLDADGQHNNNDVPSFLEKAKAQPRTLIAGKPQYDESVPKHRLYARYLTHVWVWINTLSFDIEDSMCGFRVYPLAQALDIIEQEYSGDRMDFDPEVIVRWHWRHWAIEQQSTKVTYPVDGISHFLPRLDNWLISKMHCRLFFGMLRRLPERLIYLCRNTGTAQPRKDPSEQ